MCTNLVERSSRRLEEFPRTLPANVPGDLKIVASVRFNIQGLTIELERMSYPTCIVCLPLERRRPGENSSLRQVYLSIGYVRDHARDDLGTGTATIFIFNEGH